ncbi:MAG TPA: tripartite tricarboxylate transporter TctB family protein [Anaerolineae bacterium]|nr:tripartite tricarboxylate transporter TctB family protein [Anaerolineae bacterium]HPL28531.1 tripartite tricarboxylate transporter TctB family protein [Anaerolineae bacterium]
MKRRITGDAYLLMGIMLLALFFGYYSLTYATLKSTLVPGVVSGLVFVLAAVQLAKELSQSRKEQPAQKQEVTAEASSGDEEAESPLEIVGEWWQNGLVFAWLVGYVLLIYLFGFVISTTIFVLAYLRLNRRSWVVSTITAVMAAAFMYIVFVYTLRSDLFPGIIVEAVRARFSL